MKINLTLDLSDTTDMLLPETFYSINSLVMHFTSYTNNKFKAEELMLNNKITAVMTAVILF
jgi:hypothetical protein